LRQEVYRKSAQKRESAFTCMCAYTSPDVSYETRVPVKNLSIPINDNFDGKGGKEGQNLKRTDLDDFWLLFSPTVSIKFYLSIDFGSS